MLRERHFYNYFQQLLGETKGVYSSTNGAEIKRSFSLDNPQQRNEHDSCKIRVVPPNVLKLVELSRLSHVDFRIGFGTPFQGVLWIFTLFVLNLAKGVFPAK